jgi:CRISPR/Cas system-associated protein endoribonuclease Cas2
MSGKFTGFSAYENIGIGNYSLLLPIDHFSSRLPGYGNHVLKLEILEHEFKTGKLTLSCQNCQINVTSNEHIQLSDQRITFELANHIFNFFKDKIPEDCSEAKNFAEVMRIHEELSDV